MSADRPGILPADELFPLVDQAASIAQRWETTLRSKDDDSKKAEIALRSLREGEFKLDPPKVIGLNLEQLKQTHPNFSRDIEDIVAQWEGDVILLSIPVLLWPARSSEYDLVELGFNISSLNHDIDPQVLSIFPTQKWKSVIEWGGEMSLALDNEMNWGIELHESAIELGELSAELKSRIAHQTNLSSFFKILPYKYEFGRSEIEASKSFTSARWRIDCSEEIRNSDSSGQFVAIVKVPKGSESINVECFAQAEISYQWLTGQLKHIFGHFVDSLPEFANLLTQRRGIGLQDYLNIKIRIP